MAGAAVKVYLWFEFGVLYLLVPYANAAGWIPLKEFWFLIGLGVLLTALLLLDPNFDRRVLFRTDDIHGEIISVLKLFALVAPLLAAMMWALRSEQLFYLPRDQPWDWLYIILQYPFLSVYPQELIYRVFLNQRYRAIFPGRSTIVFVSAAVFAFYHLRYSHWVPVAITFFGGLIFMSRFLRTRAVLIPTIEHSLYGVWVFTVGFGVFFRK